MTTPPRRRFTEADRLALLARLGDKWPRLSRAVLTDREARILALRIGIVNNSPTPHRILARRFDLSQVRTSVIECEARAKLIAALAAEE